MPLRIVNDRVFRAIFVAGMFLACAPALATEWPKSDIPADPAVNFGVLPNGMRYAIMHNATPVGGVSVRFRIGAGAMQESAAQRGLAHFLEHMAFRGSAHVADGEIDKTLARLGLRFGGDTNASTSQDETIYQFDLPKSDDETVDTALNFTREIASNLTLDAAAAKTEAGVVLSELKLRGLPAFRAQESELSFLLQDPHAAALANGDPAIVGAAPIQLIRDYYQAYYRPERATLVVVGDFDPAKMEAKIKARFSDWKGTGAAGADPKLAIPLTRGLEAKTFAEAAAPSRVLLAWVKPADPKPDDTVREKAALIDIVALQILNRRLREAAAAADRPFTRAGASQDDTLHAAKLVTFSIGYQPGQWQSSLDKAEKIRLDMLQSGVTQADVDRTIAELHSSFENANISSATRSSRGLVGSILSEVSDNDVFTSPARDLAAADQDMKGLTAADVTAALRNIFRGSGPLIFVSGTEAIPGGEEAVKTAFLEAEKSAGAAPLVAAAPSATGAWPYANFGKAGAVTGTEQIADLGASFIRFANGVRLSVKPSKLRANQVLVSVKVGGGRLDLPTDRMTAAWAAGAVPSGGLKALSFTDMQRTLTPKNYRVGFGLRDDGFIFSGNTTPADIDTQLQVLTAYLQAPGFRPESFEQVKSGYVERLGQVGVSPAAILQLKGPEILHGGDKRWVSPSKEDAQSTKLDDLKSLLTPFFEKGAIDVTIVGDITTDKAVQAVAATFGALPKRPEARPSVGASNNLKFPADLARTITIPGSTQDTQEIVVMVWPTHGQYADIQDTITLQLMSDVMETRLFDKLRGLGTVYVAQVGSATSSVFDYGYVQALAQLPPDKAAQFDEALGEIVADLQAGKITDDDLARARNPALQDLGKTRQTNEYWLAVLDGAQENRKKLDLARNYDAMLKKVTLQDIAAAARKYLVKPNGIRLATGG